MVKRVVIFLGFFLLINENIFSNQQAFFDGERFYNLGDENEKGFYDFLKWVLIREPKKWPEFVKNPSYDIPMEKKVFSRISYTWINHATVLIQVAGLNVLTDPIFSERCSPVSFAGPKRVRDPGVLLMDLPQIDVVLISHNHYDHLDISSLKELQKKDNPLVLVGLGNKKLLIGEGLTRVRELDWWDDVEMAETVISYVPARHFSGRGVFDRNESLWGGFVIKTPNKKIYFAGDTGYGKHFSMIKDRYGAFDLSFIPIGAYSPQWFMAAAHLNPKAAVKAHLDLESKKSVGIHFGTFQLTDEGIDDPKKDLEKALLEYRLKKSDFVVPNIGEPVFLP